MSSTTYINKDELLQWLKEQIKVYHHGVQAGFQAVQDYVEKMDSYEINKIIWEPNAGRSTKNVE